MWCAGQSEDPVTCSVPMILEFLPSLLDGGQPSSSLGFYFNEIQMDIVTILILFVVMHYV